MTTTREPRLWRVASIFGLLLAALSCGESAGEWPCAADAEALCPQETERSGTLSCLRAKDGDLSPACSEELEREQQERQRDRFRRVLGIVCAEDVEKYCGEIGVYADRESVADCLDARRDEIAPLCRSKLRTKIHQRVGRLFDTACRDDIIEHCGDLSRNATPEEVSACLDNRRDEITDVCKDMIDGKILSKRKQEELARKAARAERDAALGKTEATADGAEN